MNHRSDRTRPFTRSQMRALQQRISEANAGKRPHEKKTTKAKLLRRKARGTDKASLEAKKKVNHAIDR